MSYPERLLPQANYKFIDFNLFMSRSYYLVRHTESPQITNEEGRLKADLVAFQIDHLRDYSTNLLGEFAPRDICWNWLKGTDCTNLWQEGDSGLPPVLGVDVESVEGRGCFYLAIHEFQNTSFHEAGETDKITCRVLHTPTRGNFWHCSLRWWRGEEEEDVAQWDDPKAKKRRRNILSSARTFIITNAVLSEPPYQAISPEAYS